MKLNFNFPLKDLSGNEILDKGAPVLMNVVLANTLMSSELKIGDPVKKYSLALKIFENGEIDLDSADFALIKDICKLPNIFAPIVQGQLLMYLNSI